MQIYQRFKEVRKSLNMTQTAFGNQLGKGLRAIQHYEAGERSIDNSIILLLQEKFNVNTDWLINGNGSMFLDEKKEESVNIANLPAPNYELPTSFLELCCKLKKEDLIRVEGYIQAIVDSYKNKDMQKLSS